MRGLVVVRDRAKGAPCGGFLEKHTQQSNQHSGNQCGVKVFFVDQNAALKYPFERHDGLFGHANVNFVNVAAKNGLTKAVQKVADAQGGHQQGGAFLVHQVAQNQALNHPGHHKHDEASDQESQHIGHQARRHARPFGNPFGKPRHGQCREQHHRPLREVKDARGFEDQHKAQCDQRIQHAGHQAAQQSF